MYHQLFMITFTLIICAPVLQITQSHRMESDPLRLMLHIHRVKTQKNGGEKYNKAKNAQKKI
jgi:hypothetical protein